MADVLGVVGGSAIGSVVGKGVSQSLDDVLPGEHQDIAKLHEIERLDAILFQLVKANEGLQERNAPPSRIRFTPDGVVAPVIQRPKTRFRTKEIIHSGGAGKLFQVKVGAAVEEEFFNVTGDVRIIPFETVIEPGSDLQVINATDVTGLWRATITGYTE